MENLTIYGNIAGNFILANSEIILNVLFLILFICIMIWDFKLFNKVLKQRGEYAQKSFILSLINKLLIELIEEKNNKIEKLEEKIAKQEKVEKELNEEIYALNNQKKSDKYRLERKYTALETAILMFYGVSDNKIYANIRATYLILNKWTLSRLEKENELRKKDLKKDKKNI